MRQVIHALLTRPPLSQPDSIRKLPPVASFDLHVLGTPPAFILSQDQTLMLKVLIGSKFRLANFQPYPFTWFRSEFFSNSRSKPDLLVLRIFRVLHTVQSSIIKVLCVVSLFSSNFYILSQLPVSVNSFFNFFCFLCSCVVALTAAQESKK